MKKIITKTKLEETVKITKRGTTVKSDEIAKIFEKLHKDILRIIDKKTEFLTAQNYAVRSYFIEDSYVNNRGKKYRRFQLTRKGFDLVILSLTGKNAELYKLWYIDEFHKKSEVIKENKSIAYENNENPLWLEFRNQGKEIRTKFTDAINDYLLPQREAENKETSQFISRYISSYTKLIYKKLDIKIPKGVLLNRDTMDMRVLFKVEQLEEKVSDLIKEYANIGINYKDIYQKIKKAL